MQNEQNTTDELLYFWAIGDMHFRASEQWQRLHTSRMKQLFADLHMVWQQEGKPAFCVSPGDIVDKGAAVNYALAQQELVAYLGDLPFYPGIGNHEFQPDGKDDTTHTAEEFSAAWQRPVRYAWTAGRNNEIVCIMLDQPNPFLPGMRQENHHVVFSPEQLTFLDIILTEHAERIALIFAHCPLHNTVLDRDPERNLDDDSLDPFFFVENSAEVRAILARHRNALLYISGHTHSGWNSPQLVFTEMLGEHPVTHLNLMSPWYTGRGGPRLNAERTDLYYRTDTPDVQASFAIHIYADRAIIRVREHATHQWLAEWTTVVE